MSDDAVKEGELRGLIAEVLEAHPGPWDQREGYGDGGGYYVSIIDAYNKRVFDGESGWLSDPAFNLLLNFPEIVKTLLPSPPLSPMQRREEK